MQKKIKIILCFFILCICTTACYKEDEAPSGPVNFTIDLANAQNVNLLNTGGYEYYSGGYNGVVVFRYNQNEFVAYERACPKDHDCQVEVDDSRLFLECKCCHSQFIYTDGSKYIGEAHSPLRQYQTYFNGGRYVQIMN